MRSLKKMFDKKVLITGINSFTGRYLAPYLESLGYRVYGISSKSNSDNLYRCDITSIDDITDVLNEVNPDFIIHLAGISFTAHSNIDDFYRVNTIGTINLLDTVVKLGLYVQRIVIASSATVYGNLGLEILDEHICPKPANHYGASKYSMECLVANYFDKLPIIITRPFNYTGVGQVNNFLIPKIVEHFKHKKNTIELGNLDVIREFNDIEFVCEVYKRLLKVDISSTTVNICSSRGIRLLDVIKDMEEIAKYKIDIVVNPKFVRKDEIKTLIGSNKRLIKIVGDIEQKDFKTTLRDMFEA